MKKEDFFTTSNLIEGVTQEDYRQIRSRLEGVKAFARISNQKLYVIDYYKKNFLYVSDQFANFFRMSCEDVYCLGFDLYVNRVPDEDLRMLMDINMRQFDLLDTFLDGDKGKYAFSADSHFNCNGRMQTVCHKLTPFAMKDGKLWLALCAVSLSSNEECGNATIRKEGEGCLYKYDSDARIWREESEPMLNEMELDVVSRTMNGATVSSMASFIYRTMDTIKSCKKKLFAKLGVKNMYEALVYVINNHMW